MSASLMIECWASLAVAIIFGVLGTISMKISHGLEHIKPAISLVIFYSISFVAMTYAMQYIQLSVLYAVWSGVGTVLVGMVGIFYFDEAVSVRKILFLLLIIVGVIGIHISDSIHTI